MYIVYFNNKSVRFDRTSHFEDSFRVNGDQMLRTDDIAKLLKIFEISDSIEIISEDFEKVFAHFCSFFVAVEAAGGVVADRKGHIAMIHRRGRWDLPKGHCDANESLAECAAREIEEECGLSQLAVDEELCSTLHIYDTYGRWELKRTTWFAVRALGSTATTPQTDEDIALVEWYSLDEAVRRATNESYPTIAQVIYEYKNKL
ncbi:MAG: NUDIX domain-containing protein [Rikenellaceae bacterium]|nr:NUDIX domain-containing protein [Rikenellaceae bacterium]